MSDKHLIAEFNDMLAERAAAKGIPRHQAFIDWYVEAEFHRSEWARTDDAKDGGVDAIVTMKDRRPPVVLIQSKFSERIGSKLLSPTAYRELDRVVAAFKARDEAFDEWLGTVREDLRTKYRQARKLLRDLNDWRIEQKAFRLITTMSRRERHESQLIPQGSYVYGADILELYRSFRKGYTPMARPLTLRCGAVIEHRHPTQKHRALLFNADLADFRAYLAFDFDITRLVARNVRFNLGSRIGKRVRSTYEERPHDFWFLHNGLTLVCDSVSRSRGTLTLQNPSVVNGAQSLYAVSTANRSKSAKVTTRVIVRNMSGDAADQWMHEVIRGVNSQNLVRPSDLCSNEPEQVEIQRRFRDVRVFYERKRGEWRDHRNEPRFARFQRVSLRSMAFALTAAAYRDGRGVQMVKRGELRVFDDKNYREIFPDRLNVSRSFERLYLHYRLWRFMRGALREMPRWRRYQTAFWTTYWLAYLAITDIHHFYTHATVDSIRAGFDRLEASGRSRASAGKQAKLLLKSVWKLARAARTDDGERVSAADFFKAQSNNSAIIRKVLPKHRASLRKLGQQLLA